MPRYVAFLRGVSPMNAKMADLRRCFEDAGFSAVRTVLGSGNVVFDAAARPPNSLARQCEAAMLTGVERTFLTIVRPVNTLEALIEADAFSTFRLPAGAKRVVTFLAEPWRKKLSLPIRQDDASILHVSGSEAYCAYVPGPRGPVFMKLIEDTFGANVTTRTWDTVRKCAAA
jgi:uncharacterized protein (DUF1697 family)